MKKLFPQTLPLLILPGLCMLFSCCSHKNLRDDFSASILKYYETDPWKAIRVEDVKVLDYKLVSLEEHTHEFLKQNLNILQMTRDSLEVEQQQMDQILAQKGRYSDSLARKVFRMRDRFDRLAFLNDSCRKVLKDATIDQKALHHYLVHVRIRFDKTSETDTSFRISPALRILE